MIDCAKQNHVVFGSILSLLVALLFVQTSLARPAATTRVPALLKDSTPIPDQEKLRVLLNSRKDLNIKGEYRFVELSGRKGFQPTSLRTQAYIETNMHQRETGTLTFWFSPMEDLDFFSPAGSTAKSNPDIYVFPLISDVFPGSKIENMNFGIFWNPGDPQIMAKFSSGGIWTKMDHTIPPFVTIEKIPMREGHWYQMALTWNKRDKTIRLYVNGYLMAYNNEAADFSESSDRLYLGCPMFALSDIEFLNEAVSPAQVKSQYRKGRSSANDRVDEQIAALVTPALGLRALSIDKSWKKVFNCPFTNPEDLKGWSCQTDPDWLDSTVFKCTPEGLLFKTPDKIDLKTRATLWGPRNFEGDQCLDVEFRLESPQGLALIIMCASGLAREDFIAENGLRMVGDMGPVLHDMRNYHWEFMRRVNVIRTDMETQSVYKNPWGKHLYNGVYPKLQQGRWYKLRMIKLGSRIQGSLDGEVVFDVKDDAHTDTGPIYNFGRIAFRHMYQTTIRYRNLVVYEKNNRISNQ